MFVLGCGWEPLNYLVLINHVSHTDWIFSVQNILQKNGKLLGMAQDTWKVILTFLTAEIFHGCYTTVRNLPSLVFDKTDFFVSHKLFIVILLMCYLNEQLESGSHYFGIFPWFHFFPLNKISSFFRIFAIYFNFRECFQVIAVFIYEIIGSKMSSKIRQQTHFSIKISRNLSHSAKDFLKTIIPFSFSAWLMCLWFLCKFL